MQDVRNCLGQTFRGAFFRAVVGVDEAVFFVFGVVNQPERIVIAEDEFSGGEIFLFPDIIIQNIRKKRACCFDVEA